MCFFAHTLEELRVPMEDVDASGCRLKATNNYILKNASANIEKLIHDASHKIPNGHWNSNSNSNGPFAVSDGSLGYWKSRTPSGSQQTIVGNSWMPSYQSSSTDFEMSELYGNYEKGHHLDKALTDLLNGESEIPSPREHSSGKTSQRDPLSDYPLQNIDPNAMESGLLWNGGPPQLFVAKNRSIPNSLEGSFTSFSSDVENVSGTSSVISKSLRPFLLASQLSNFAYF